MEKKLIGKSETTMETCWKVVEIKMLAQMAVVRSRLERLSAQALIPTWPSSATPSVCPPTAAIPFIFQMPTGMGFAANLAPDITGFTTLIIQQFTSSLVVNLAIIPV